VLQEFAGGQVRLYPAPLKDRTGGGIFLSKPQLLNSPLDPRAEARRESVASGVGLQFQRRSSGWRDPLRRRMLALSDVLALAAGCVALGIPFDRDLERTMWALAILPLWIVFAKLYGLYDRDHTALRHLTVDELPSILFWTLTATAGTTLLLHATPAEGPSSPQAIRFWVATVAATFIFRVLARFAWRRMTLPERVLILGDGPVAVATRRKLTLFPDIHAHAIEAPQYGISELFRDPQLLLDLQIDRVILATESIHEQLIAELVAVCRREEIKLSIVPPVQGMFGTATRLTRVADLPVVEYNTWDVSPSTLFLKRTLDVTVSSAALVVLAPLFFVIALVVFLDSPGAVVFSQVRVGAGGRRFRMHKFRTMVSDAEARLAQLVSFDSLSEPMFKLPNDPRVTRVGRFLRRTSLDELPQLFNVFKGDMSLVGPRPEQVELVERYKPEQLFRLNVKPGLTGPMQVYGRGQLTFEERLSVERDYIGNLTVGRDLRILALTLPTVASRRGAS
jgi:exopolysaccharide biosynthesis polyprenyl glycosylphosphotransferase